MNKMAFTLTEMMIVVIIITGLMFLIVPNINKSKESVDNKTCDAYIKLVDVQIQAYLLDKNSYPASIDELVTNDYIKSSTCPNGTAIVIFNNKAHIPSLETTTSE